MFIIFIRSVIIFLVLLVILRLMGKRQIGEMQPFELVITLVIAELACIPMSDISVPLVYGISAILALFILHQTVTIIDQKSLFFKRLVSGTPSLVINREGVNFKELKKNNLDLTDLIETMRSYGYFSIDDLEYAIFEANGKFSALEKTDKDLGEPALSLLLVNEGKINTKNLNLSKFDNSFIMDILNSQNIHGLKKVQVLTVDSNGKVFLQVEGKKYKTFHIELPKESKW